MTHAPALRKPGRRSLPETPRSIPLGSPIIRRYIQGMPMFVHLAPEKYAGRIRRNGIRRSATSIPVMRRERRALRGVFCMPVMRDFYVSHQWLRELRRSGHRMILGVYFKVAPDENVYVGRYQTTPVMTTASGAIRIIEGVEDPRGFEVVIPRRISADEIVRIRPLKQNVGWRYWPLSHARKPCPCEYCQKGTINSRRIRERGRG